jgi:hypothetical protein
MVSKVVRGPDGRIWGVVEGNTYTTTRRPEHFVWKFNGWGIQLDLWNDLKRAGVESIVVRLPSGALISRMTDWERFGRIGILRPDDGEQIFLEQNHFSGVSG